MKKPSGPARARYRLSPNEVEQLKKEETERRRKLRILQVREQAKTVAAKIRNDVKQERERQLLKLAKQVEEELQNEKEEEVRRLEKQYENTLRTVGQGHLQAKVTDESICHTQQLQAVLENKKKAEYRHQEALRKLAVEKAYKEYEETKHVRDRHAALEQEKKRAAEVAARPPPPPDVVSEVVGEAHKPSRPIPLTDLNAFSATHYHIPEFAVERAPKEQQHDGKLAGEGEDERLKEELEEKAKREHDQLIRARIRGSEALKKEMLKHEYDALVADLSLQQRLDRRRRQGVVAKIPKQVFLPPDRRLEEKEDKQLEMERAFEDMYLQQINVTGDLSLTLDPVPESTQNGESTATNESSSMIMPTLPPLNPALRELTNVSRGQRQTSQEGKPETSLKRLLNKIKEQQSEAKQSRTQQAASDHVGEKPSEDKHRSAFRQVPAGKGHPAPSSAQPDPQLDLSPLRSQANKRPDKQEVQGEVPPQQPQLLPQPAAVNRLGDAGDAMFLERLKERLQAIEVQNSYLDKKIKDQQKMQQHFENQVPGTTAPSSLPQQHQVTATSQFLTSRHMSVPQTNSDDNIGVQPTGHSAAIDVGATSSQGKPKDGVPILSKPVLESKPTKQGAAAKEEQLPFTGGSGLPPSTLQSQRLTELSVGAKCTPLSTGTETAHPQVRSMPRFSASVAGLPSAGFTAFSGGYMPGMSTVYARQAAFGTNYSSVPSTEDLAVSVAQAQTLSTVPSVSLGQSQSLSAGGDLNPAGCLASRFGTVTSAGSLAGFPSMAASLTSQIPGRIYQPVTTLLSAGTVPSALPLSHLTGKMYPPAAISGPSNPIFPPPVSSQLAGRMNQPLAESLSSAQIVGDHTLTLLDGGDETSVSKSGRPENLLGTLGSLFASGFREQENIQRIREYQRQLAEKHAERMKTLSEMRVRIEGAQRSRVESKTLLAGVSGLGQLPDPSILAPYTLHTLSGQPSRFLATLPSSAASQVDAPMSSTFVGFTQASSTDATSSAQGDLLTHHSDALRATIHGMADREDVTSGVVTSKSLSSAGKLDSVRKSLPFESPDKSQMNGDDAGDASMANDSHLSSSTECGSPVLAGHSKHAGSRSTDSDRSVGASSLIAHAEEKRLNFEHRTKELQDQLEEIQLKKEELLRRYHDNQPWTSAQKENVHGKPQESEATARTSKRLAPVSAGDAAAIASTVHVPQQAVTAPAAASWAWDATRTTANASLDLEERSFSSDCLSRPGSQRSWANILEDYSSQDRNQTQTSFKSPSSMTLEEVSFTSDTNVAKKVGENGLSGSSTRLLQEKSIITGNRENSFGSLSLELEEELLSVGSNHDGLNIWPHSVNQDRSSLSHVLLPDVGSTQIGLATQPRSHLLTPKESGSAMEASASPACLPPPPSRLPVLPVMDYQPHELSTIIEVDTPQTASKSLPVTEMIPSLPLVPGVTLASGASVGTGARRCIDFSKRGSAAEDDKPPESRFSASGGSGSSGSSGRHTVVEVFHHIPLHSSDLLVNLGRPSADMNENLHCREPEFTKNNPSSQVQNLTGQGPDLLQMTADISSLSSGQELFPLDLTSSAEESQVRQLLDFSDADSRPQPGSQGDEHSQAVLRSARQFNPELMAAIQQHADDVFDQSSLMSLSHYTDESVSSRT